MSLFHFSENPNIEEFVPRPPLRHPESEARVWAIDAWHAPLYYFPSDCPRVSFWPLPTTSPEDRRDYWLDSSNRMVTAIEHAWVERLQTTAIYRYELDEEGFVDCHDHGVFVSDRTVVPLDVQPLGSCLDALAKDNVELRLCPSLVPLGERMMQTSFHWSLIRISNAQGWEKSSGKPTLPTR